MTHTGHRVSCSLQHTARWRKSSLYLNMFGLAGISKASPLNQDCRHCLHFLFTEIGRLSYAKFPNPVYLLPPSQEAPVDSSSFPLCSYWNDICLFEGQTETG